MRSSHAIWAVSGTLLLTLGFYVGAYSWMLTGGRLTLNSFAPVPYAYTPTYRFGGKLGESFFEPIHQIDRKIRPVYWCDEIQYWMPQDRGKRISDD